MSRLHLRKVWRGKKRRDEGRKGGERRRSKVKGGKNLFPYTEYWEYEGREREWEGVEKENEESENKATMVESFKINE